MRILCLSLSGLSTVEAYNHKTNEWMYVGAMNTRRSSVGVGVVNGETELVVCVSSLLVETRIRTVLLNNCVCVCVCR